MNLHRTSEEYDDEAAAESYLDRCWVYYQTDLEKRCLVIGARRAKALHRAPSEWSQRILAEYEQSDPEIRSTLDGGYDEFYARVRNRILREFQEGLLTINRCPRCRRIVQTPLARQCLWCRHDWHERNGA